MKQVITIFATVLLFFSCSKSDDKTDKEFAETPSAKAAYDNSNFGVYKGIFVGSSGFIIIDINNDNTVFATLIVHHVTDTFTTTQTVQQGQPTTINFISGANSFTFTVAANGTDPVITNLIINGHPNAAILIVKETSTALVKCFEGTYGGRESGIFNALIYNGQVKGLSQSSAGTSYVMDGMVANNHINAGGTTSGGSTFVGTMTGNNISGTWSNVAQNASGTWSGSRTY
jgi:hypothetical protein